MIKIMNDVNLQCLIDEAITLTNRTKHDLNGLAAAEKKTQELLRAIHAQQIILLGQGAPKTLRLTRQR